MMIKDFFELYFCTFYALMVLIFLASTGTGHMATQVRMSK